MVARHLIIDGALLLRGAAGSAAERGMVTALLEGARACGYIVFLFVPYDAVSAPVWQGMQRYWRIDHLIVDSCLGSCEEQDAIRVGMMSDGAHMAILAHCTHGVLINPTGPALLCLSQPPFCYAAIARIELRDTVLMSYACFSAPAQPRAVQQVPLSHILPLSLAQQFATLLARERITVL